MVGRGLWKSARNGGERAGRAESGGRRHRDDALLRWCPLEFSFGFSLTIEGPLGGCSADIRRRAGHARRMGQKRKEKAVRWMMCLVCALGRRQKGKLQKKLCVLVSRVLNGGCSDEVTNVSLKESHHADRCSPCDGDHGLPTAWLTTARCLFSDDLRAAATRSSQLPLTFPPPWCFGCLHGWRGSSKLETNPASDDVDGSSLIIASERQEQDQTGKPRRGTRGVSILGSLLDDFGGAVWRVHHFLEILPEALSLGLPRPSAHLRSTLCHSTSHPCQPDTNSCATSSTDTNHLLPLFTWYT